VGRERSRFHMWPRRVGSWSSGYSTSGGRLPLGLWVVLESQSLIRFFAGQLVCIGMHQICVYSPFFVLGEA